MSRAAEYLAELLAGKPCWYDGTPSQDPQPCPDRAVFSVLRREFDAVRPDPDRDNRYCCREHLALTAELTDEDDPGCVVHVSVLTSTIDRLAADIAEAAP